MNVLYINHTILKSGAGISLATLLRNLPGEVRTFFMLRPRCEIKDMLRAAPERTFYERFMVEFMTTRYTAAYSPWLFFWHLLKAPLAFFRMAWLKKRWSLEVVHLNETTLLIYAFAARFVKLPVVIHARTALAKHPFEHFLLRRMAGLRQVRIVAIDSEVKKSLPDRCQAITQVIYNPIDLGPSATPEEILRMRESWRCTPENIIVGQVASLHAQKGVWLILELAEQLCHEFPLLKFVLVGDDSPRSGEGPALRDAIRRKDLESRIVVPGYDERLSVVYGALDVALCLFGGGLGGVGRPAYEAAVAGKALIATLPDAGASETLREGVALVSSPDDRAGLSDGLRSLIRSRGLRHSLGWKAKLEIGKRHDPAVVAAEVMELYQGFFTKVSDGPVG